MQIDFEWHTKKLDSAKKETFEKLIKMRIASVAKNCFGRDAPPLIVSLIEEESPAYKVRGAASTVESGEKKEVIELEIDQGFFIKCNKFDWFDPKNKL